ncbi:MAG: hypothetical protein HUU22_09015 [Phycisphaerae bacterium]|nr:hypothetical protein [Phycisphaerae bacterium]NUQ46162.1 hypothetical protein [Phycisphaerae bacterium]
MDLHQRLEALLTLAEQIGLEIRRESLGGDGGGLCELRGRRVLFVDSAADIDTRYERTLAAIAETPEWESRYVSPELREDLDRMRGSK